MSINGDGVIMRNGKSTSQVSIYNYPEHLNPFYEDDQHKRLRFWPINKNNGSVGRSNSFSLSGLRDIWAFKSFRLKKKSSTLGVNKTSESPPPLRRSMHKNQMGSGYLTYDRRDRYTISNGDARNFDRNAAYRSSLQNVHSGESPVQTDFNRNGQCRRTIQNVSGVHLPMPPGHNPKRYVYGGSTTPQPLRGSRFGRGDSTSIEGLAWGSSQTSVMSTNPFDSDNEEDANEISLAGKSPCSMTSSKRTLHKKRRAPAPPVPVHNASHNCVVTEPNVSTSSQGAAHMGESILPIEKDRDIAYLTAEIESFVRNVGNEASRDEMLPNIQNAMTASLTTSSSAREMVGYPEKQDTESEHIECIQIHVDGQLPGVVNKDLSRVTSFRSDSRARSDEVTEKTLFTLVNPPKATWNQDSNDLLRLTPDSEGLRITEDSKATSGLWSADSCPTELPNRTKPSISVKPGHLAVIHNPTRVPNGMTPGTTSTPATFTAVFDRSALAGNSITIQNSQPMAITKPIEAVAVAVAVKPINEMILNPPSIRGHLKLEPATEHLKIVESRETLLEPNGASTEAINQSATVTARSPKVVEIDSLYRATPRTQYTWKISSLAPLEPNVPTEKRKSVKDIIESINRSQRLLHEAAHKKQKPIAARSTITDFSVNIGGNEVVEHQESSAAPEQQPPSQQNRNKPNSDFGQTTTNARRHERQHHNLSEEDQMIAHSNDFINICQEKMDNAEIFKKSRVDKEVYDFRETSPTSSNLDWNPVPKPKRTKNVPDV